jgi:dihydroorotate dehydrogenase
MTLQLAKIDHHLRPLLGRVLPRPLFVSLYSRTRAWYVRRLAAMQPAPTPGNTFPVEAFGLRFRNDLSNAAGLDKDGVLLPFQYAIGAGYAIVGTVLSEPHTGNLMQAFGAACNPWTPLPGSGSALNSLGLPSKGIGPAIDNIKRFQDRWAPRDFPIGLSVMGHPLHSGQQQLDGILSCVTQARGVADFVEINESCPNCGHDDSGMADRIAAVMAERGDLPVLVKLAEFGDVRETVRLFTDLGVNGLVGVNTQKRYAEFANGLTASDKRLLGYYTKEFGGGLSGPAIAEFARDQQAAAAQAIAECGSPLKLVHVGGIANHEDVVASRQTAVLREWYTGFMEALATRPLDQIYAEMTAD